MGVQSWRAWYFKLTPTFDPPEETSSLVIVSNKQGFASVKQCIVPKALIYTDSLLSVFLIVLASECWDTVLCCVEVNLSLNDSKVLEDVMAMKHTQMVNSINHARCSKWTTHLKPIIQWQHYFFFCRHVLLLCGRFIAQSKIVFLIEIWQNRNHTFEPYHK